MLRSYLNYQCHYRWLACCFCSFYCAACSFFGCQRKGQYDNGPPKQMTAGEGFRARAWLGSRTIGVSVGCASHSLIPPQHWLRQSLSSLIYPRCIPFTHTSCSNYNQQLFYHMQRIMDAISNQLFSFELGVQPNKDTFQSIAATVNKGCKYPKLDSFWDPNKS